MRYYGGKFRLAPWIIAHFPPHECYVEPFCGASSVFLRKWPAAIEVINDRDQDVINFFRVLREQADNLIRAIFVTPYSRTEFDLAWEMVDSNPLEQARRYYVRAQQGWSGGRAESSGWRLQHSSNGGKSVTKEWGRVEHLYPIVQRLKHAIVENDDALTIIERYDRPHTLFYLDPPYLAECKNPRYNKYQCEVDYNYHCRLLEALQKIQGMAIISGYPSDLYDRYLGHWQRHQTEAQTLNPKYKAIEVIWLSPNALRRGQPILL